MVDKLPTSTGEFTGFLNHQHYYHRLWAFEIFSQQTPQVPGSTSNMDWPADGKITGTMKQKLAGPTYRIAAYPLTFEKIAKHVYNN